MVHHKLARIRRHFGWTSLAMGIVIGLLLVGSGCQNKHHATTMAAAKPGGAQLWADNCMRCHNLRPPTQFSNNEWQIIVHHMRVRANLTGEEERDILTFIKSANMQ